MLPEGYPRGDKVGVLRTLLNSSIPGARASRGWGYLQFVAGFLARGGVRVDLVDESGEPVGGEEEDELLELGRDWCEGDSEPAEEFRDVIEELIPGEQNRASSRSRNV